MAVWTPGLRLGPYELLALIGAGGMGEVWKARDTRLGRVVAMKRLKPGHSERFEREARAIAALNHPHICTLHDVGPDYLVMEYVEGKPLKGPLELDNALRLALQIADALQEAHSRGILHRDLKPANILVTEKGVAKLLDFGIAKLMDSDPDATRTFAVSGTPSYMSPEQAEGKPADERSDVFGFGAVLYEMLSGARAFDGLAAVLRGEPAPLNSPAGEIVARCLAKQPARRFQTAAEIAAAIQALVSKAESKLVQQPSIAVLPFANMSLDKEQEFFSDGLAEEIINALAHLPGLKVIARTSAFAFKDKNQDVRRIAEALSVGHIMEGSVRRAGNRIRVTAQLINAADGSHLWSERYDRELTDVFAVQDEIAAAIAKALQVKLGGPAARRYTPNLSAYEAYLRGRHHLFKLSPESFGRAKVCLEQAIALDPGWAQPHADLGLGYLLMALNGVGPMIETLPLVRAKAERALELDPAEPDPHFLLGSVAAAGDYDWNRAARHFRAVLAAPLVSADAHWAYASLYLQPLGRFQEAVEEMRLAVEQDPLNVSWRGVRISHLAHAGLYDQALAEAVRALEIDENNYVVHTTVAETYCYKEMWAASLAAAERAYRAAPWNHFVVGMLAGLLARLGQKDRAAGLVRAMGDSPLRTGRALYHLLCSEIDAAADWLERAIDQREVFAIIVAQTPMTRALRESPRWPALAKRMNLPADR
jgi:serine/threonine-protein kinase